MAENMKNVRTCADSCIYESLLTQIILAKLYSLLFHILYKLRHYSKICFRYLFMYIQCQYTCNGLIYYTFIFIASALMPKLDISNHESQSFYGRLLCISLKHNVNISEGRIVSSRHKKRFDIQFGDQAPVILLTTLLILSL